jgi:chaperonin GroEL (HSP60 family)
VRRALSYPLKLIAKNAGVNGSVVTEKVQGVYSKAHDMFCISGLRCKILKHMEMPFAPGSF